MRRLIASLAAALSAAAITAVPAVTTPASAAEFDIYNIASPGLNIVTGACRYIPVTARTTAPSYVADIDARVDLWLGGSFKDTVSLERDAYDPTLLTGRYYFCASFEPAGTYRLGPTEVSWNDEDYTRTGDFVDDTTGTMVAKQGVRAYLSGTRSGAVRTVKARLQFFAPDPGRWYHDPKNERVVLQRRAANGTGTWRYVTTRRTDANGAVLFRFSAGRTYAYRVVAAATSNSWRLESGSIVR